MSVIFIQMIECSDISDIYYMQYLNKMLDIVPVHLFTAGPLTSQHIEMHDWMVPLFVVATVTCFGQSTPDIPC